MKIFLHEAQPHQHTREIVQNVMVSLCVCEWVWLKENIFTLAT